jgi:hypothetical protein
MRKLGEGEGTDREKGKGKPCSEREEPGALLYLPSMLASFLPSTFSMLGTITPETEKPYCTELTG